MGFFRILCRADRSSKIRNLDFQSVFLRPKYAMSMNCVVFFCVSGRGYHYFWIRRGASWYIISKSNFLLSPYVRWVTKRHFMGGGDKRLREDSFFSKGFLGMNLRAELCVNCLLLQWACWTPKEIEKKVRMIWKGWWCVNTSFHNDHHRGICAPTKPWLRKQRV